MKKAMKVWCVVYEYHAPDAQGYGDAQVVAVSASKDAAERRLMEAKKSHKFMWDGACEAFSIQEQELLDVDEKENS